MIPKSGYRFSEKIMLHQKAQKTGGRAGARGLDREQMMEAHMPPPARVPAPAPPPSPAADSATARRAIAYLPEHWRSQPEIEAIAAAPGVPASDLPPLFRR